MLSQWRGARVAITSSKIPSTTSMDCKLACSTATGRQSDGASESIRIENLDVPETSHDLISQAAKGPAGDLTPEPLLSVVCPDTAHKRSSDATIVLMAASTSP